MKLVMNAADTFIHDNIAHIIDVIDSHDAGILNELYICPCRFVGTQQQWHTHIADLIVNELAKQSATQAVS